MHVLMMTHTGEAMHRGRYACITYIYIYVCYAYVIITKLMYACITYYHIGRCSTDIDKYAWEDAGLVQMRREGRTAPKCENIRHGLSEDSHIRPDMRYQA